MTRQFKKGFFVTCNLFSATCLALLLAPSSAQAQCTPTPTGTPLAPAPASGTIECQPGDYADGINYSSLGDLILEIPSGADDLNVFEGGINVTGNGADTVRFDANAYDQEGEISGTADAVIDFSSDTGDISIENGAPVLGDTSTGSAVRGTGSATHAIRAGSTGGGNIDISVHSASVNSSGGDAIEAVTAGGDVTVTQFEGFLANTASISSGTDGTAVHAETSGTGNVLLDLGGNVNAEGNTGTAIRAIAGTGDITINTSTTLDGVARVNADSGATGIHASSDGLITINARTQIAENGRIGILTDTSNLAVINIIGSLDHDGGNEGGLWGNVFGSEAAIRSLGNNVVVNVSGDAALGKFQGFGLDDFAGIRGALDFSALTGHAEVNVGENGVWFFGEGHPSSQLSGGDDLVAIEAGGVAHMDFTTSFNSINIPSESVTVDFGSGDADTLTNAGVLLVAPSRGLNVTGDFQAEVRTGYEGHMSIENLEAFHNSGAIYLGARLNSSYEVLGTEGGYDDILSLQGADFVGSGDSRIYMDVFLNNIGNSGSSCDVASRDAEGDFAGSDCLDLRGGTASGRTEIVFNTLIPGDRGALNPDGFLVVDLAGGSADPDAFVVSPESDSYGPQFGGVIDKGLFFYPLAYDAETQQFRLYGQPGTVAQQIPILGSAASDLWRTATDGWFGRQVDQRNVEKEAGLGGGVWANVTASAAERDVMTPIVAGIETFEFDNSYTQDDSALTLGVDLISRSSGNVAWVFGPMLGYARSRIDFDAHPNTANLEGPHVGFYGSLTFGDFYLDAVLNGVWLDMDYDVPALDLFPEGTLLGSDVTSLGGQIEAGWGGLNFGRLGIEPLASLSYVKTEFEDVYVPASDPSRLGGNFEFQDPESLRAGLGVRLSLTDVLPGFAPTHLGLTARVLEEAEGESTATITSTGPIPVDQTDTFDGTFAKVTGSVSISNAAKTAAGYLNVDGTFESDYESVGIEAGFRYQW